MAGVIARYPQLLQTVLTGMTRQRPTPPPGYEWVDPNDPTRGLRVISGGPGTRLPDATRTRLTEQGGQYSTVTRLGSTFRNNFSMPNTVWGGDMRNWLARYLPTFTTPDQRAAAEWWQSYARDSEIIERHALFGAALTATEQAAWRAADINPNMAPDMIRRNLQRRQEILTGAMRRYARGLAGEGFSIESIAQYLGVPQSMLTGQGSGPGAGTDTGEWQDLGGGVRIRVRP
jgi:hypothetical protein